MSSFTVKKVPEPELIGIVLIKNTGSCQSKEDNILGFISLTDTNVTASILRDYLTNQLPGIPTSYHFLTKNRWPVQQSQENTLNLSFLLTSSQSIYIQTTLDTNRVGIILTMGKALGFVFIDHNSSLINLRTSIECQLKTCTETSGQYRFLDSHKWPITYEQEKLLTIFNVIRNCEVIIEPYSSKKRKSKTATNSDHIDNAPPKRPTSLDIGFKKFPNMPPSVSSHHETSSSDTIFSSSSSAQSNLLFISYVRAEASDHALDLKRVLSDHGINVFLDVHEIKAGVDWQDSLNEALLNCQMFIALVTELYGRTKWTNREVKVADMNNKIIVPISFLKTWPPDCLAIQFASTHYIPWKTDDDIQKEIVSGEEERACNTNFWDTQHVNKVADIIIEKYKALLNNPLIPENPELTPQLSSIQSESSKGFTPTLSSADGIRPLIVISVHPNQKSDAHELRLILGEEKYEVWCSTDTFDFTQNVDINTSVSPVTHSAMHPPMSLFNSNNSSVTSANGHEENLLEQKINLFDRRRGKRLSWSTSFDGGNSLSQLSDCSHASSLSPDKVGRLEIFKTRVKNAVVVILLISQDYIESKMSKNQAYYCEHRKKIIPVTCGNITLTTWMTSLLDNVQMVKIEEKSEIRNRIKEHLKPSSLLPDDDAKEGRMCLMVKRIMAALGEPLCNCVYIAGSSKFYNPISESICHAIGLELAHIDFVALVTGGFFGVGDSVGRNFCEERQILRKEERIFHILPEKDSTKFSSKAKQDDEGRFLPVPFGKTFFVGDNVKERECLVARLFNICILIEGGPGAAHEVEQFMWNDHVVIPIIVTGGAAGGKFGVPSKLFVCPPGVSDSDWAVLSKDNVPPEKIAAAVRKIICSMHKSRDNKHRSRISQKRQKQLPFSKQNTIIQEST
ncbi:hypothetical protein GQR58_022228 [Nymphon striatum]|nr:hypothetical protein GQR58_022228 [Nymphon striatum]